MTVNISPYMLAKIVLLWLCHQYKHVYQFKSLFSNLSANMPSLESGMSPTQFDNVLLEFLRDRGVADMVNAMEALRFEYSYWPQRSNYSWVRQESIDVSIILYIHQYISCLILYHILIYCYAI